MVWPVFTAVTSLVRAPMARSIEFTPSPTAVMARAARCMAEITLRLAGVLNWLY